MLPASIRQMRYYSEALQNCVGSAIRCREGCTGEVRCSLQVLADSPPHRCSGIMQLAQTYCWVGAAGVGKEGKQKTRAEADSGRLAGGWVGR